MDMVITKSISRFARNTVTLLETVQELKLIGVNVYFEEQNVHSNSADVGTDAFYPGILCTGRGPVCQRKLEMAHQAKF